LALGCQAGSALLGPDALQGIDGLTLLGPMCPVQQAGSCPDQPYRAWLSIYTASGQRVTRLQTGQEGRFHVGLEPGVYTLHPESGDPFPRASDQTVEVAAGSFVAVTIHFDTGIR
jgi:hypothetical protein